jgi:DNA sulfur modification protein DndD
VLLRSVRLSDVGLYGGEQTVEFSCDRERPVTLIGGRNGTGKTTLLNAIQLALYGNRAKNMLGVSAYPEYLHALIHKMATKASVALEFQRREGGRPVSYLVEREWTRSSTGKAPDALYVTLDGKPRPDLEENWAEFVEGVMPLSVSGLAIFDGEKIEALADVDSSSEVLHTALFGLLGLDLVDRLQRDLVDYRRRVAHQAIPAANELAAKLKQAEDQLAVALADADAAQSAAHAAEREVELASAELAEVRAQLAAAGGDVFCNRERLHEELLDAEADAQANTRRLETLVAGDLPLLLVAPLLRRVAEMGGRTQAAHEAALLLSRIKERDERVVARALNDPRRFPPESARHLAALLAEDRALYEGDHDIPFKVPAPALHAAQELLGEAGAELADDAAALVAGIAAATVAAELARRSLQSVPAGEMIEEIVRATSEAESRLRSAEADRAVTIGRRAEADRRVAAAQREVDRLATAVLEAGVLNADTARIAREIDRAEGTLTRFAAGVVTRHIDRISSNITKSLHALLRKEGLISRVSIDPSTLKISLYGRHRKELDAARLSAGERQMLATAVLWGLSRSTGRNLPTVIDTPVGRLDRSHRTNLVDRYFPQAARQMILLSTDEEIVGRYFKRLQPHVGRQYLLEYDEETEATRVREGYFR